ncbi:hypothetical protein HPB48_004794 [Haemaphysalis longicornis]|uniref:Uncharacterized protein n=1 Tax=Haemaphysalis longicornis TaxID=44386 RepID=A0A9J6F6Z0_HAELO|nr:hypothetical protein HPB48_004794 [Haemaphysalis longicornis]
MLDESNEEAADALEASLIDNVELNDSSDEQPPEVHTGLSSLKQCLRVTYGRHAMPPLGRYFRSVFELAKCSSNLAFLERCRAMCVVPRHYRAQCRRGIKYTRRVGRILDETSYRLMLADLQYSRLRKEDLRRFLVVLKEQLENNLSLRDLSHVADLGEAKYAKIFDEAMDEHHGILAEQEYGIEQN